MSVLKERQGLGLELGPLKNEEHGELCSNFAASVVQVSSAEAEASLEKIPVGSVLFRINGSCVEGWAFDACVQRLSLLSSQPLHLEFLVREEKSKKETSNDPDGNGATVYKSSWVFLPPNWVLDADEGRIWQIGLCLEDLAKPAEDAEVKELTRLCEFLMRRANGDPLQLCEHGKVSKTYPKHVLLELLRRQLDQETLQLLNTSILFKTINGVYLQALRERSGFIQSHYPPHAERAQLHQMQPSVRQQDSRTPTVNSPTFAALPKGLLSKLKDKDKAKEGRSPGKGVELRRGSLRSQRLFSLRAASFKFERERGESPRREVSSFAALNDAILGDFLEDFRKADGIPLKDIRCSAGKSVVLQIDLFTCVFLKLLPPAVTHENRLLKRISQVVAEYVRSLHYHFIPIEQYIFELLAWLMVMSKQEHELHQLLLFQIPTPSNRLAETLLSASVHYEPFWQVAIHMLFQLKDYRLVLAALLNRKQLFQALHLLLRFPDLLQDDQEKERSIVS